MDFIEVALPAVETTELKVFNLQISEESPSLQRCAVNLDYFAALTFFAERGAVGGHVYQPNVNHRIMSFENLSATRIGEDDVVVTPMLRSMIFNEGKSSFSAQTKMRLFPYEVVRVSERNEMLEELMSPAPLSLTLLLGRTQLMQRYILLIRGPKDSKTKNRQKVWIV